VVEVSLDAQFRCGGSRVYEEWVLRLLGLDERGPVRWAGDTHFELRTAASLAAMEATLLAMVGQSYGARMTAGFCWPWSNPRPDGSLVDDVVIDDWSRP